MTGRPRPALAPLAALLALWPLTGCDSTTGLERAPFTLRAGGLARPAGDPLTMTTAAGWQVRFEEARLAVGPLYLNVAPPLSGATGRRSGALGAALAALLSPLRVAHAQESQDHLGGGRIVAQVTQRVVIDALAPALGDIGPGDGVSEHALTAEVWLLPAEIAEGGLPARAVAYVAGVATRAGEAAPVPFAAALPLDESMADRQTVQQLRAVRRIPADVPLSPGGVLELRVDPRPWLETADFTPLRDYPLEGGRHVARPDDSVMRAMLRGVRLQTSVYAFAWTPAGGPM